MFSQLAKQLTPVQVSSIFKQMKTFVGIPDVLNRLLRIGNIFSFRSTVVYDVSMSWNDILLYWIEILVCKNGPKLKRIINDCKVRYHQSIVGYTLENSELVRKYSEIVWASIISSLGVTRYECLPPIFYLTW